MRAPLRAMAVPFAQRAVLLALGWWAITEGTGGWGFAAPVILCIAAASIALAGNARKRVRLLPALRFATWFLGRSLVAGTDVALRAFRRRPNFAPAFMTVPLRLESTAARVLLADAMCLVPGTLTAALEGCELTLHVLDREAPVEEELRTLERYIADLLGEAL